VGIRPQTSSTVARGFSDFCAEVSAAGVFFDDLSVLVGVRRLSGRECWRRGRKLAVWP
jgi:hypothetical protein